MKFSGSSEITIRESLKILQNCFVESTLSRTEIFEWYEALSERREFIENLPRTIRPTISVKDDDIEKVKETVLGTQRFGIRDLWIDSTFFG